MLRYEFRAQAFVLALLLAAVLFLQAVPATHADAVVATLNVGSGPTAMAVNTRNGDVYVAQSLAENVLVISGSSNNIVANVSGFDFPRDLAFDPANGNVYVGAETNNLYVMNGSTGAITADITNVNYSDAAVYDPGNGDLYLANGANNLVDVLQTSNDSLVATVKVDGPTYALAYDPANGDIYAAQPLNSVVSVIQGSTNTHVKDITVPVGCKDLSYDSANGDIYVVGDFGIPVIQGSTNEVVANVTGLTGFVPTAVAFDSENSQVYIATYENAPFPDQQGMVATINGTTNKVVANISAGNDVRSMAFDPVNGNVYLASYGLQRIYVISPSASPQVAPSTVVVYAIVVAIVALTVVAAGFVRRKNRPQSTMVPQPPPPAATSFSVRTPLLTNACFGIDFVLFVL
jgi:DNA-binding beta-propeller fold protein YncE